jgi:hypothetical protein
MSCNKETLIYISSTSKNVFTLYHNGTPETKPHGNGLTPAEPNEPQAEPQFGSETLDLGIPQPFLSQRLI